MNVTRESVALARRAADAGDTDTALAHLADVARGGTALDTRMRFFEVVGVLERAGIDAATIHAHLGART